MNQQDKKILIACEESQAVCIEFRKIGFEAYSCDILPCSGNHPEWHIKNDVLKVLDSYGFNTQDGLTHFGPFDFVISFQPCTDIAVSGARWFPEKRANGSQEKSIRFFFEVWKSSDVCENPIGILSGGKYIKQHYPLLYSEMIESGFPFKASQIIQPWQFGHGETKATCLFLNGKYITRGKIHCNTFMSLLPLLKPTNVVDGREHRIWKLPPSEDRAKQRSKTYSGIAKAMAEQWGNYILNPLQKNTLF